MHGHPNRNWIDQGNLKLKHQVKKNWADEEKAYYIITVLKKVPFEFTNEDY